MACGLEWRPLTNDVAKGILTIVREDVDHEQIIRDLINAVEGLAGQQAMPDDFYVPALQRAQAALAPSTPEAVGELADGICQLRARVVFEWDYDADLNSDAYKGLTAQEAAACDQDVMSLDVFMHLDGEPTLTVSVVDPARSRNE